MTVTAVTAKALIWPSYIITLRIDASAELFLESFQIFKVKLPRSTPQWTFSRRPGGFFSYISNSLNITSPGRRRGGPILLIFFII